ncbi:hypothetical protein [Hathewaya limosa]|uniref:Phage protein n=1 Tax=Hathewaya limosa TaxID=1536 RepID=A0ABU0JXW4_HATLI|nr:hypothetical protein [Hathewaya limosa]MDQ0480939.1 hypothetical protein [Hathewaya limosa]
MKTFSELAIEEQVKFINRELKRDKKTSVTKLCKNLNINKSTFITRCNKNNFKYNFDSRQYEKQDIDKEVIQKQNKSITKVMQKHNKSIIDNLEENKIENIQKHNECISKDIQLQNENITKVKQKHNKSISEEMLDNIKELLEMKEQLKEVIQEYNKSKSIVDIELPKLELDKGKFKGEPTNRLIKVYKNINDNWIKFCKEEYSEFKMQDLYSMALMEFMDKYSKNK